MIRRDKTEVFIVALTALGSLCLLGVAGYYAHVLWVSP